MTKTRTIEYLVTGYFYADGGAMFGAVPKESWIRRYDADEKNRCIIAMRTALIQTEDGRIILIDTGCGTKHLKTMKYYDFFGLKDLRTMLRERGIQPEDVTDVILTHLHFDHASYCTEPDVEGNLSISFPNAQHWTSQKQWESTNNPHPLEKRSLHIEDLQMVKDSGKLNIIDSNTTIYPGIHLELYDGHTDGQIAIEITMPDRTVVFAGDIIPLAASLSLAWISAYDINLKASYNSKVKLLTKAAEEGQEVVFCHDHKTVSSFVTNNGKYFSQKK